MNPTGGVDTAHSGGGGGLPRTNSPHQHQQSEQVDMAKLRERLRISDEWNVRLQNQIQELLRLPRNEVEAMRDRMQSPEIAIPLLQCYDAAIQEKAEENDALRKENARLTASAALRSGEHADLNNAVRIAEELAKHVQGKSQEETMRLQGMLKDAQAECSQLRQELSRALDAENEGKHTSERLATRVAALAGEVDDLQREQVRLEEALRAAGQQRRHAESAEGETQAQREAQKIQLSLLTKENEDRFEELERLRAKMIQALRQAADNHNAHMKTVEERHAIAIGQLRAAARTQELEVLRMRAQLARAGSSSALGSVAAGGASSTAVTTTTTQLLEAQTRQAQELEIKRLYNSLAQVQQQRDDAVVRYEQLTSTLRRDREQQQLTLRRDTAALARERDDEKHRAQRFEAELVTAKKDLQQVRDAQKKSQAALQQLRTEKETTDAHLHETKRKLDNLQSQLAISEEKRTQAESTARERAAALEQRVEATLKEIAEARQRAFAECERALQERDEAREQRHALQERLSAAQRASQEGQQGLQIAQTQSTRLSDALDLHKKQLASCDERLLALQAQLDAAVQQNCAATLAMERLKLENAKLLRARARLITAATASSQPQYSVEGLRMY